VSSTPISEVQSSDNDPRSTVERSLALAAGETLEVPRAQVLLLEIVVDLMRLEHQLQRIERRLPRSTEHAAMINGEVAPDVATELGGCIEFVLRDCISPAISYLRDATQVSDEDLRRDFEARQRPADTP